MAGEVQLARLLLTVIPAAMFVSTSLTVGVEFLLYALFAASPELRRRLCAVLEEPLALALAAFAAAMVLASLHGEAPWSVRLGSLVDSRKLLLFFLASAVFDDRAARDRFVLAFLALCALGVVASVAKLWWDGDGIVLRDDVIQSLVFAVGAWFCLQRLSWPRVALLILLCGNIAFVSPARSGYVVLVTLAAMQTARYGAKAAIALALACALFIAVSTQARDRIAQGWRELTTQHELTSMGWRIVMWHNAGEIIRAKPIFGVGLGGFEVAYRRQVESVQGWQAEITNDPHNQYLRVAAECGLVGLNTFLLFIWVGLRGCGRDILVAWCIAALFASTFSRFVEGRLIFLLLGVWSQSHLCQSRTSKEQLCDDAGSGRIGPGAK